MLPSTRGTVSASTISVFRGSIAHPARLLSTLRTPCCHDARKTRSRPARYALAGRDFHPQDNTSFSQRTPRSTQKPGSSSCHLYAGRRPASKQAPSGLILELSEHPSSDVIPDISTPHRWFAVAHLLDPHLIPSNETFSLTLTTPALYQRSLRRFETCSCKPAPRGLPSSFVQLRTLFFLFIKCARGTLRHITGF